LRRKNEIGREELMMEIESERNKREKQERETKKIRESKIMGREM
jgi:hypothetical protein